MFFEKTIRTAAKFAFFLMLLILLVITYSAEIQVLLDIAPSSRVNWLILFALAIDMWVLMYCVFGIIASKACVGPYGLLTALQSKDNLRVYRIYKYIVTKEARAIWEADLTAKQLIQK